MDKRPMAIPPLSGRQSEDNNRQPIGLPGGTQHTRDADGVEERDTINPDGTVNWRSTRPIPNPQEQAIADAKAGKKLPTNYGR